MKTFPSLIGSSITNYISDIRSLKNRFPSLIGSSITIENEFYERQEEKFPSLIGSSITNKFLKHRACKLFVSIPYRKFNNFYRLSWFYFWKLFPSLIGSSITITNFEL